MLQLDLTDPELRELAAEQARHIRRRIAALLRAARATGRLDDCDPEALATTVHTAYNGALITWALEGTGALADWVRTRVDAVLEPDRRDTDRPRAPAKGPGSAGTVVPPPRTARPS